MAGRVTNAARNVVTNCDVLVRAAVDPGRTEPIRKQAKALTSAIAILTVCGRALSACLPARLWLPVMTVRERSVMTVRASCDDSLRNYFIVSLSLGWSEAVCSA